jgi:Tol biopolymer transport system component
MQGMNRRRFIGLSVAAAAAPSLSGCRSTSPAGTTTKQPAKLFFSTQGRTGLINADGSGLRHLEFKVADQVTWQPGPFLSDGRRVIFLSMEARRDGPGRPFAEYYHKTPTHLWLYDLERDSLTEIATRNRLAVFYTPALLVSDDRLLVQVVRDQGGQIFSMNLDGSDAREFTHLGEGLPYGMSLSPDGRRVAYHLASPQGYQIWTSNTQGGERIRVAAHPDHLYFGPSWSPDGQWLVFQDCHVKADRGHDWCDLYLARPDGSEGRLLTEGQAMWFDATYGNPKKRGGGSNLAHWTRDGQILFPRRLPGSKVPWEFQTQRPDTDHFNRDFKPELARGGTEVCRLDPRTGSVTRLTQSAPPVWDFRTSDSADGRYVAFCRAEVGGLPALWVMDADGTNPRRLTRGLEDQGTEHPRWLPQPSKA